MKISTLLFFFTFLFLTSCSVQDIEKYNSDFKGKWRTAVYYSPSKSDSIRNYLTVDGKDSGFGIACNKNDPFNDCTYFEAGKIKFNKANKGIQVGNSVSQIHTVNKQPFINDNSQWEIIIDSISYYKY